MQIRTIATTVALAASVLVSGAVGATAASPDKLISVGSDSYTFPVWVPGKGTCKADYMLVAQMSGTASGPYFQTRRDRRWTGTARISMLSGTKKVATVNASFSVRTPEGAGKTATWDSQPSACADDSTLRAAGLGSRATSYTFRIESASFKGDDKAKHSLVAGVSRKIAVKQLVRVTATSRKSSGASYTWTGKVQQWKKSTRGYAWAATEKGIYLTYASDSDNFCASKSLKTAAGGTFTVKGNKSSGYLVMDVYSTKTRNYALTEARVAKSGALVHGNTNHECE